MSTSIFGANAQVKPITNASYYIFKGEENRIPVSGVRFPYVEYATFYSADGDELKKVTHQEHDYRELDQLIDPSAPKPRPVKSEVKYWPGIPVGYGINKAVPGDFIIFSDKNGNYIRTFRYDKDNKKVMIDEKLSLPVDQLASLDLSSCSAIPEQKPNGLKLNKLRLKFLSIPAGLLLLGYGCYELYKSLTKKP